MRRGTARRRVQRALAKVAEGTVLLAAVPLCAVSLGAVIGALWLLDLRGGLDG